MRVRNVAVLVTAAVLVVGGAVPVDATPQVDEPARAVLRNQAGATVGSVTFQYVDGGRTQVRARVTGLTPLSEFHGFHLHTNGACTGDFVASAGGHWNPGGGDHGDHQGDMPVLYADKNGVAESSFTTDAFSPGQLLNDPGGIAVIVHTGRDNYANIPTRYSVAGVPGPDAITKATGDAGSRYACGVVDLGEISAPTGYWTVASDGGVFAHGTAGFFGSQGGTPLTRPVVGMAATPSSGGYYLTAADGGVFTHGDASFQGSAGGLPLVSPVVGMALPPHQARAVLRNQAGAEIGHVGFTQDGSRVRVSASVTGLAPASEFHGFHVHATGACTGDFTGAGPHWNPSGGTHGDHTGDMPVLYADATGTARATYTLDSFTVASLLADDVAVIVHAGRDNYGSIPARYSNGTGTGPDATTDATGDAGARFACGVVSAPGGSAQAGYWLVAADGGVFAYGDAPFLGRFEGASPGDPIVGMAATPTGNGYWLVAAGGGVLPFGDAVLFGDLGAITPDAPIVGMAATPTGKGYLLFGGDGGVFAFGDAAFLGRVTFAVPVGPTPLRARPVAPPPPPLPDPLADVPQAQPFATPASHLTGGPPPSPIEGGDLTESGYGYALFGPFGEVYTFGDAAFEGSETTVQLARPIVGGATRR